MEESTALPPKPELKDLLENKTLYPWRLFLGAHRDRLRSDPQATLTVQRPEASFLTIPRAVRPRPFVREGSEGLPFARPSLSTLYPPVPISS